jgi:hypothetical protein
MLYPKKENYKSESKRHFYTKNTKDLSILQEFNANINENNEEKMLFLFTNHIETRFI